MAKHSVHLIVAVKTYLCSKILNLTLLFVVYGTKHHTLILGQYIKHAKYKINYNFDNDSGQYYLTITDSYLVHNVMWHRIWTQTWKIGILFHSLTSSAYQDDQFYRLTFYRCHPSVTFHEIIMMSETSPSLQAAYIISPFNI